MNLINEEIEQNIELLKEAIRKNETEEKIKEVQKRLNKMLEIYLKQRE